MSGIGGDPPVSSSPKLIYFASRHPDFDESQFIARWRQHARLGMSMPRWRNIRKYAHCDRISGPELNGFGTISCDGVAIVWYVSEATRLAHIADTGAAPILKADELETFDRPVREVAVLTEESPCVPDHGGTMKLFLRVCRDLLLAEGDFLARWRQGFVEPVSQTLRDNPVAGYWHNARRINAPLPGTKRPYCDSVEEFETGDAAALTGVLLPFLESCRGLAGISTIWTRPSVLHDSKT